MSLSIQKMVSDGTLSTIVLGVQYLQRNDMYLRIAGVETPQSGAPSGYTWSFIDNNTIRVLPAVPAGVEVVVYRRTDLDEMYNIYSQNAQFDESTIDENNQQLLYIAQEYFEQGIPAQLITSVEYTREDTVSMYYRLKLSDGSYTAEFAVPKGGAAGFEALRRTYADAGLTLVDGSFETGGTLTSGTDVLLLNVTAKAYAWTGAFPKVVAPGTDPTAVAGFVMRSDAGLRGELASSTGASLVKWVLNKLGSIPSSIYRYFAGRPTSLMDFLSDAKRDAVLDYSIGADCTTELIHALAACRRVELPAGLIKLSDTIWVKNKQAVIGQGPERTKVEFYGSGGGFALGYTVASDFQKYVELSGMTIHVKTSGYSADAVSLQNCVRFKLSDLVLIGPGTPSSQGVLTGNGLHIKDGSFIGTVSRVYAELFNCGARESNSATNADLWTAAIVYDQQCEFTNNNYGMILGTTESPHTTAQGSNLKDVTIEFNYMGGLLINNGIGVDVSGVYFESNGNYDIQVGHVDAVREPICVNIHGCNMPSGNIVSPYGATPYQAKIKVVKGVNTNIHENNISNPSGGPCITVASGVQDTGIYRNRVNTTDPTAIVDAGSNSIIYQNKGHNPNAAIGLTLLNGWVNVGGVYQSARYYLSQDLHGRKFVVLDGAVNTGAAGTTIATLPVGFRPTGRKDFVTGQTAGGQSNGIAVLADGSIVCSIKSTATVCLCGIIIPLG